MRQPSISGHASALYDHLPYQAVMARKPKTKTKPTTADQSSLRSSLERNRALCLELADTFGARSKEYYAEGAAARAEAYAKFADFALQDAQAFAARIRAIEVPA